MKLKEALHLISDGTRVRINTVYPQSTIAEGFLAQVEDLLNKNETGDEILEARVNGLYATTDRVLNHQSLQYEDVAILVIFIDEG